jgi:protein tyrosine phosphatase (PTP) superfamily phosphohydrolase (DUF442 family)
MRSVPCLSLLAAVLFAASSLAQTITTSPRLVKPEPLSSHDIENFFQLTENIYSGSSPENEESFAELKRHGIKTIISVDGAKPDVEAAKKLGLRYVHLPIGYDSVPANRVAELTKAAITLPGPIYVHCHHGKHRGPAGAAVICMATEGWTPEQGLNWLKQAGTATNYSGLYKSVAQFKPLSPEVLAGIPANLPEKMEVSSLVDVMVEIDERFDHLNLVKDAGYKQPPSHPDINPAHEALLLHELFNELLRSPEMQKRDHDYQTKLAEAEQFAREFHAVLNGADLSEEKANAAFQRMGDSCSTCHKAHRN